MRQQRDKMAARRDMRPDKRVARQHGSRARYENGQEETEGDAIGRVRKKGGMAERRAAGRGRMRSPQATQTYSVKPAKALTGSKTTRIAGRQHIAATGMD